MNTTHFRPMRRSLRYFFLSLAVSAVAVAQQPTQPVTPSVDRLRETVTYLASDALEGRRTGSAGANDAARYIAGEFQRLGLRPGFPTAKSSHTHSPILAQYEQKFPYVAQVNLGKQNQLLVKTRGVADGSQFKVNVDWMPLGFSANGTVSAEFVFAGYGITSSELKYDDYAVSPAKDRVAVVFAGTPDGDNPHGQFARAGELRFKVAAAQAAGARALLIIANEEKLNDDRLARLAYDNTGEASIPVAVISRATAARILHSDRSLAEYEKIADSRTVKSSAGTGDSPADSKRLPNLGPTLNLSVDVIRREAPAFNVIGILEGSDPQLKNEAIVLGAHYDHLGRGGEGSLAPREGEIHHGADDNASGVAGMLELARIFSAEKPRRTMVFIAFSGEEEGLLGSDYYVKHPVLPLADVAAMINMDMIGRMKDRKLVVGGIGTAQEWRSLVGSENRLDVIDAIRSPAPSSTRSSSPGGGTFSAHDLAGFQLTLNEDGYGPSDHSSFYSKQVPVLFFWTGSHEDYHKPSDTADKINYADQARIIAFIATIVRDIGKNDKRPTYTVAKSEQAGRATGFKVYLGTIPNYAESSDGVLLDGVRDDSPAAKAGMKAGDRIVKLAGHDVRNVYDYTYALGEMKAGQEYEIEVTRGGERLKLRITPAARK